MPQFAESQDGTHGASVLGHSCMRVTVRVCCMTSMGSGWGGKDGGDPVCWCGTVVGGGVEGAGVLDVCTVCVFISSFA